jgi:hypothetical protein
VDIDFGDVSIKMRNLLREQGKKKFVPAKAAAMAFLTIKDPATIKLVRKLMIDWGYKAQRLAYRLAKSFGPGPGRRPGSRRPRSARRRCARRSSTSSTSRCRAGCRSAPRARCSTSRTTRSCRSSATRRRSARRLRRRRGVLLPGLRLRAPVLAGRPGHAGDALRNRRADRAAAGLPVLRLPADRGRRGRPGPAITTDNRVLFHRVANTLNYLDIKTVIVSCGTCMDQLQKYQFEQIFPGCRLLDIHEYLLEKGVKLDGVSGTRYMYHDPCHAPMRTLPASRWSTS